MKWYRSLALRYGLPTLYVLVLPFLWSDSGASRDWEFFEVPRGFAGRLWEPTALLAILICVQVWWLDPRAGGGSSAETPLQPRWTPWVLAAVLGLFALRAGEYADIFPVHHLGEMNSAIHGAAIVREHGVFSAYNAGFGVLFAPFFEVFGTSFPVVRTLTIGAWAVALVGFCALYSALHRGANHPLILVPPAFVAMILPSLRTYTWHAGAVLASVGAFFLVVAIASRGRPVFRSVCAALGAGFYVAGFTAYHAAAVYLLVVGAVAVWAFIPWRPPDRIARASAALVILLAVLSTTALSYAEAYPLADRVVGELHDSRPNWNKYDNLLRSWDNFFYSFLWHDMSFPGRAVFLVGLAACLASARRCLFARTSLVMFGTIYGAQIFFWGHADWSQNCYTIVPILGVIVVGLRQLAGSLALAPRPWAAVAAGAATIGLAGAEYRHYFSAGLFNDRQYEQHAYDTHTQLSLALRDARALGGAEEIVFFMPALSGPQQPVSYETHGLEWKHPASRAVLARMRYFTSAADLAAQVRHIREGSSARIRIYFGYPGDHALDELAPYLERLPPEASLVMREPYRELLHPHARLLVTYVDLAGS
jgi:hypothetical protein